MLSSVQCCPVSTRAVLVTSSRTGKRRCPRSTRGSSGCGRSSSCSSSLSEPAPVHRYNSTSLHHNTNITSALHANCTASIRCTAPYLSTLSEDIHNSLLRAELRQATDEDRAAAGGTLPKLQHAESALYVVYCTVHGLMCTMCSSTRSMLTITVHCRYLVVGGGAVGLGG